MSGAMPDFRLDGKHALITGAGRGIGLAIAQCYAAAGAELTLCARTGSEIESLAEHLRGEGAVVHTLALDVTNVAAFESAMDARPPFDIFVNNAGTNRPKPLFDVTEDDFDAIIGLNLRAAVFCARAVTRRMVAEGRPGSVINMSSQMGHVGARNRTIYCASKWAIEGFTKALSIELGSHGIRVNTICPTFIETPMSEPFFRSDPGFRDEVVAKIKLGRLGQVDDVVGAALFLASGASALMTGSALMLDGGWTAD